MSKSRKTRRDRPPRFKRRRIAETPERLGLKEKTLIFGVPLAALLLMLGLAAFSSIRAHQNAIEARVQRWKSKYDLSDSLADKILEAEREFHTKEHPLSFGPKPTAPEKEAHRGEIAKLLGERDPDQINEEDSN